MSTLPPLRQLAKRYSVPRVAILSALHALRKEGTLEFKRGSRIRVVRAVSSREADKTNFSGTLSAENRTAAGRWFCHFRDRIKSGEIRVGEPLPKVTTFAGDKRISPATVTQAYRLLLQAGLATKAGKSYLVGPTPPPPSLSGPRAFLLVICRSHHLWSSMMRSERVGAFARSFQAEADSRGVYLTIATFRPFSGSESGPRQEDKNNLRRLIKTFGAKYRGVLLVGRKSELGPNWEWLRYLGRMDNRPVVWFDDIDEGKQQWPMQSVYRCHFSESEAISAAKDFLKREQSALTFVPYRTSKQWEVERAEMLVAASRGPSAEKPNIVIQNFHKQPEEWLRADSSDLLGSYETLFTKGPPLFRKTIRPFVKHRAELTKKYGDGLDRRTNASALAGFFAFSHAAYLDDRFNHMGLRPNASLCWTAHELSPLLIEDRFDSLISLNDGLAKIMTNALLHFAPAWFKKRLILSFDNHPRQSQLPLATIDFGFSALGYKAFHLLLGDIPIKADRKRQVPIEPFVVDRRYLRALVE